MTGGHAELVAATNYSFLDGASTALDMVASAASAGLAGIGIADRNTVAGVVRAHYELNKMRAGLRGPMIPPRDFRLVVGARLVFADGTPDIVAYPATRLGWGRLTRLLTVGNLRAEKGDCILGLGDLIRHLQDLLLIVLPGSSARAATPRPGGLVPPQRADPSLATTLARLARAAPGRVWLGVTMNRGGRDGRRLIRLERIADQAGVPLLATSDALYAHPDDKQLGDIMACIREGVTVRGAGKLLAANAERHIKDGDEIRRLFARRPDAVAQSLCLLAAISFDLVQLSYEYPHEPVPAGWEPQAWLEHLSWAAARAKFPGGVPDKLAALLHQELPLIAERRYAYYFLTVYDIVRFAREECQPPILCQGRGSAANSAVCWLLGVTSVDPLKYDLLFSRFVSSERDEPPDIDIDFEHERREEVMQYIYTRYGRHRAAIAGTVIHFRPRSAVREIGKALGLSADVTNRLTSTVWGSFSDRFESDRLKDSGFDEDNPQIAQLCDLVRRLLQFPRHLSQHVGGFVLTHGRLDETVPIHHGAMKDRTFIEWDKDDIDYLKIMKVDILALGMLTCIRKAFDLMHDAGLGQAQLDTVAVEEDDAVYAMLQDGDSVGVFQVESRAQINMLPRLKPAKLYDLVVQVAIVRPGPIEGDMVHPYLRRRAGKEIAEFPSPAPPHDRDELRTLLGHTFGVPLFQEQAMKLAMVAAEFTPEEANQLRKAMATFRHVGGMDNFHAKLVGGMTRRGYDQAFAERCYKQIEGFGSYGFPESHALSFARLVYVSSWLKCFYPAIFGCAILNSQPMGFYAPAQLVRDAAEHGVELLPIDVNHSEWDNRLASVTGAPTGPMRRSNPDRRGKQWDPHVRRDGDHAIRLGFRQIDGFRESWAAAIVAHAPFTTVEAIAQHVPPRALHLLADADALRSLGLDRRGAGWEVRRTPPTQLALFAAADAPELAPEPPADLPAMPASEEVAADYRLTRLSLKNHPMAFLRPLFAGEGVLSSAQADRLRDGRRASVAGIVLVRQRPGKGNAIFVTIEDETGVTNALMWARDFEANRRAVMASRLMVLHGIVQRSEEGVVHLMTTRVDDRSGELRRLSEDPIAPDLARGDVVNSPQCVMRQGMRKDREDSTPQAPTPRHDPHGGLSRSAHPRDLRILPKSRDFH